MKYVVYTEIHTDGAVERWYYGTYPFERADEVVQILGLGEDLCHGICRAEDAELYKVQNLPT